MNALYWWIDRWRKSTAYTDMTIEEQGAYRNLLDEATLRGGALPNVERVLARACGDITAWKRVRRAVMARFELRPDGWHNDTLDKVLHATNQRALRQQRWRLADHNAGHNADHNADHNAGHNDPRLHDHNEGHSPDPDPDQDLRDPPAAREVRAPTARAADPRASGSYTQRRRVAADARAKRGASAPVDERVKKHFG